MIPVLTKEQTYRLDKDIIDTGHLSEEKLMDNAGKAVAQFFCEKTDDPFNQKVVVICGKGNNGGDGVITHYYLKKYNVLSKIVFTEEKHGHSKLLKKYKISKSEYSDYNDKTKFDKYDWIIDGIFGIGLSRDLNNKYIEIIKALNINGKIISIDIPSGLFSNTSIDSVYIKAKHVITFNYPKLGHFINPINSLIVKNIGFQEKKSRIVKNIRYQLNKDSNYFKVEFSDVSKILKKLLNKKNIHKYFSRVNISAGSKEYPGAAILCCNAAIKTGSGYVALYSDDEDLFSDLPLKLPEVVINKPLGKFDFGISPFLMGPGDNSSFFESYLMDCMTFHEHYDPSFCHYSWDPIDNPEHKKSDIDARASHHVPPLVLDGICLQEGQLEHMADCIMTPHIGELQRMLGIKKKLMLSAVIFKDIQSKIGKSKLLWGGEDKIVILKTFNTFIITKDIIYIMDRGPSLLATAGTGDVLSGILVSLLSQGYSRLEASILGTYLHAEAANYYMNNISKDGMTASDLIDCIPHAFKILRQCDEY